MTDEELYFVEFSTLMDIKEFDQNVGLYLMGQRVFRLVKEVRELKKEIEELKNTN